MTKTNATENPCTEHATCRTCVPSSKTFCAACAAAELIDLREETDNLRHEVDGIDTEDFVTEDRVERLIENAFDEAERHSVTESDMEEAIERGCEDVKTELEEEDERLTQRLDEQAAEIDALRGLVLALQANTLRARWTRLVARLRSSLHVDRFSRVLRSR
jgi:hypothetical protein